MHSLPKILVGSALLFCVACAQPSLRRDPAQEAPKDHETLGYISTEERAAYAQQAEVWRPIDTAKLDLLNGPQGKHRYLFNASVSCKYVTDPEKPLGGSTPKFLCQLDDGEQVKVKYGTTNSEVSCEIVGSRLFWALGFLADDNYPVRLTCSGCDGQLYDGSGAVQNNASIEKKIEGAKIETERSSGWDFNEAPSIDPAKGGASRAHLDAFLLLNAFVQHWDSKVDNQRMVCPKDDVDETDPQKLKCKHPYAMVQDFGDMFGVGSADLDGLKRINLEAWQSVPIWKDKATCQASLSSYGAGNINDPIISDAGRKFLLSRLKLLSGNQITDLFKAARVNEAHPEVPIAGWVAAFRDKIQQIASVTCPR